jgi:predicted phage tail protein
MRITRPTFERPNEVSVRRIADPRVHSVARKGGGKGGGGRGAITTPHQPTEMPNTLRSRATARILELISEGPVYGLAQNGPNVWSAVFLDGTPISDAAGNFNFAIRQGEFRYGFPSQAPVPGWPLSESAFSVGVECHFNTPVVRAVTVPCSAIRYILRVPALYTQESDGDIVEASTAYAFDIQIDGGTWTNLVTEQIAGKTMSPYERAVRVQLPASAASATTINIRIERIDPEGDPGTSDALWWSTVTEIVDGMMEYEGSCVAAMVVDAEEFQNVPQRAYLLHGLMIQLPTSYNGWTHGDSGDWDGTFYSQWSNNPAWILYALLTNERWGLGRFLDVSAIDKWSFYEAQQRNDNWMSAFGEVRYTCNCVIATRQDAYELLQAVASNMMAQLYYANGTIYLVQDTILYSPVRNFGPSDVENGLFDYTSSDVRSRFTAAAITWNDPDDKYQPAVELVQDPRLVAQYGYKETQLSLFGCTSRGQAVRHGRWLIYTSQFETEIVSFRVGLENADLRPGDYIYISDPSRVGARIVGRTLEDTGDLSTMKLDRIDDEMVVNPIFYAIMVTIGSAAAPDEPGPVVVQLGLVGVVDAANGIVEVTGKTGPIPPGSMWLARAGQAEPSPWRVTAIADRGKGWYEVTATEYHQEKWTYIEQDWLKPPPPFSLIPTGPIQPPTDLAFREFIYLDGNGFPAFGIVMSWSASTDPRVQRYQLELSGPSGDYRKYSQVAGVSQEVLTMRQGTWLATIVAFDNIGRRSPAVQLTFTPVGLGAKPLPPTSLFLAPQGALTTLSWVPTGEIDVVFYWIKWAPQTDGSATWPRATTSIARVDRNTTQVNTPTRAGTFMVKSIDALGQESDTYASAILIPQQTERVHAEDIEEQPDWQGNLDGEGATASWHRNLDELWLPPPSEPEPFAPDAFPGDRGLALNQTPTRLGTYEFLGELDLGMVTANVSMVGIIDAYGAFLGHVMAKWTPLASQIPLASGANNSMSTWRPLAMAVPLAMGSSDQWDAHIDCRVSQDGATFGEWFPLKSTIITGRRFEWRMHGLIYDLATTLKVVRAAVLVEIPYRNLQGNDVPLDGTGHLTVTYVVPFIATPTVQITARQNLVAGGNIVVVESDSDHFRVEHRGPSGAAAPNGSIDYFVQGYGGHAA